MHLVRTAAVVLSVASAVFLRASAAPVIQDAARDTAGNAAAYIDRAIRPGDDFYAYANGGWLEKTVIPVGRASYDTRAQLTEKTSQRVRDLVHNAAASVHANGSVAQKVGDYYASFMDVTSIEMKGLTPLAREMASITAIHDIASLSAYLGTTLNSEVDGLTANRDHVFGVWVNQGFDDSTRYRFHLLQGGLGMPGRDHYLDPSPEMAALRVKYQAHIAAMLALAVVPTPEAKAAAILSLESRIAQAHAPDADAADVFKQNNPWKREDFARKAPGMNWRAYFQSGLDREPDGLGYPDTWLDYSTLDVVRGDAFGNMTRAEAFNRARNLAKLRQTADPDEWRIDPHSVSAVIMFSPNTETFSAGLMQPPFFDADGDAAANYGSAGAGIAHEITHSFDELGNIYDDQGRLDRWWTAEDRIKYHTASAKLAAQFDRYCPLPNLCANGKLVLNEAIADLAGLQVAHDAYVLSLKGKPDIAIDGLSGDQRFFLAFAQRWQRAQTDVGLRRQIATDNHPPGASRSNTVRNVDAWYRAFAITPSDKLYLNPADRLSIW